MSIWCLQKATNEQREYHVYILQLEVVILNSKSILTLQASGVCMLQMYPGFIYLPVGLVWFSFRLSVVFVHLLVSSFQQLEF